MHITLDIAFVTVVELSIPLVTMCYGKHAVLPVFWSARDILRYTKYLDESKNDLPYKKSSNKVTETFIKFLECNKLIVNLRRSKGKDISAACGQLANKLK